MRGRSSLAEVDELHVPLRVADFGHLVFDGEMLPVRCPKGTICGEECEKKDSRERAGAMGGVGDGKECSEKS